MLSALVSNSRNTGYLKHQMNLLLMVKNQKAHLTYLLTSLKVIKGHLLTREGFKYRYRVIYPN